MQFQDETAVCKEARKPASPYKSWDGLSHSHQLGGEQALGGVRGRKRERNLGNVTIINYAFSRSRLCLGMGLLRRVWRFTQSVQTRCKMIITSLHAESSVPPGCKQPWRILAFGLQRTSLDKMAIGWGGKDRWGGGQRGGSMVREGNECILRAADDETIGASTSGEGKVRLWSMPRRKRGCIGNCSHPPVHPGCNAAPGTNIECNNG